ncbi:MAG: hemolysin family protein [Gammaproteobacteria bacterium]|nr:hemolysin family protein [Gammaproteobacteria bacterium]MDH3373665.1 hemolysin family protein [Gammaproteobacteria bacterium]MDH3410100.1 hemolysin family protein [Gammaproteobacteria bacterium]MDH3551917.1 hemolysin family protein [Gammaproteobacteria bacterium]
MLLFITAVSVVLIVSFLCSIFESVLLSLTRPQIEVLMQREKRAGRLLSRFKENMDVPIAAILILNTAAHTIGAAVAGASYQDVFDTSTLWLFSIIFTIAVLLFTEIIPKTLGVTYALKLASPVAHGIRWLTMVLRPLVALSEKVSRSLRGDVEMPVTTPEEIRLLATLGRSKGAVGVDTAGMVVGATQLRYLHAHDIVLPRDKVRFLSGEMKRREATEFIRRTGHSRFPFSLTRNLKDVCGVVLTKDLLYWLLHHDEDDIDWNSLTKEALIVPPTVPLIQLLRTFQHRRRHLAIIIDEYGTVEGIATLEDVLEEIVGDIFDESDLPMREFHELADGSFIVRATIDLRKLSAKLAVAWDPKVATSTIGGFVTEKLERIPRAGDAISWKGYQIEVLRADKRRAKLLRIRKE